MKSAKKVNPHENIGYDLVAKLVSEGASVLDLGCGDGSLLALLQEKKNINATLRKENENVKNIISSTSDNQPSEPNNPLHVESKPPAPSQIPITSES